MVLHVVVYVYARPGFPADKVMKLKMCINACIMHALLNNANRRLMHVFFYFQTNLQFNNNKYYLLQLLEDDSSKSYSVWLRWGRGELHELNAPAQTSAGCIMHDSTFIHKSRC
jgi:hypothetical protein